MNSLRDTSISDAFSIRAERAIKKAGGEQSCYDAIVQKIREKYPQITTEELRAIGGWTRLIDSVIGACPECQPNSLGMPTNDEYYVWLWLSNRSQQIRLRLQGVRS